MVKLSSIVSAGIFFFFSLNMSKIFIEIQLIYNVVLVLDVQQDDLVLVFFRFFSSVDCYKILSIVPGALQ